MPNRVSIQFKDTLKKKSVFEKNVKVQFSFQRDVIITYTSMRHQSQASNRPKMAALRHINDNMAQKKKKTVRLLFIIIIIMYNITLTSAGSVTEIFQKVPVIGVVLTSSQPQ